MESLLQAHLVLFLFIDTVLYKSKVCSNPESSKSVGTISLNSVCSLPIAVKHFGNSHNISIFYCSVCYGGLWSVTSDVNIVIVWGPQTSLIQDRERNP